MNSVVRKNLKGSEIRAVDDLPAERPSILIPANKALVFVIGALAVTCLAIGGLTGKLYYNFSVLKEKSELLMTEMKKENGVLLTELESLRASVANTYDENMTFMKILHLHRRIDRELAREVAGLVCKYSRVYGRDTDLVLSIIYHESKFDPKAVSVKGAMGLMQLMPGWKKVYRIPGPLLDVDTNINYGLLILGSYQDMYKDLGVALTVYNRGPSQVDLDFSRDVDPTNGYAAKIMETYSELKNLEAY